MLLKIGSKGEDVKKFQIKLGLVSDGIFGSTTEEAIKSFQTKNGLTPDGIVGEGTWNRIFFDQQLITNQKNTIGGLNLDKLKGHIPDAVFAQIPETASKFEINTPLRLSHFLAQCGHESGGFKLTKENLNYSANGLKGTFGKYFKELGLAESYERKPEKIANKVYANRMGNGPESSGDGSKYCGRGYIQLTGKDNYIAFGKSINEDMTLTPEKVSTHYALLSAAWFFNKNGLNKIADGGATDEVVTSITKRVNGGTIGLGDRIKHFKEYYKLLS